MNTRNAPVNARRLIVSAVLGVLSFGCAAVNLAADNDEVPSATVRFSDIDISSPEGAAALYSRIAAAADEVCKSSDTDSRALPDQGAMITCVHLTVRNAVARLKQPRLSAIYNSKHVDALPSPITVANR